MPDPRIDAIRGCVAVERGPIVMCAESVDLPAGRHVDVLRVDPSVPPRDEDGSVVVAARFVDPPDQPWPYGDESDAGTSGRRSDSGRGRGRPDALPRLGQPRTVDDAGVDPDRESVRRMCAR